MEFTQDMAVLQSAILLADKKCGCLGKLGKDGDAKVILILTDAVKEVTRGLRGNLTAKKQDEIKFRITAVLLAMYLSDKGKQDSDDYWFSVLQDMPALNSCVLFDLIKKCKLQSYLFRTLNHVESKLGLHLLSDLVDYIDIEPDDLDTSLLLDLVEYLFLLDNPYVYQPEMENLRKCMTETELEVCAHLNKLSKTSSAIESSPGFLFVSDGSINNESIIRLFDLIPDELKSNGMNQGRFTLLTAIANILSSLVSGTSLLVSRKSYLSPPLVEFLKEKSLRNTFSPCEAQMLFLQMQDEFLTKDETHVLKSKLKQNSGLKQHMAEALMKITSDEQNQAINLQDLVMGANESSSESAQNKSSSKKGSPMETEPQPVVSVHHCRMVLDHLLSGGDEGKICLESDVARRCREVSTKRQEKGLAEQLGDKTWDWCRVAVTARLHGHKEFFMHCLSDDLPKKSTSKFLEFVEGNLHLLAPAVVMTKWLQFASRLLNKEKKSMAATTIRMMTIAAFKKLSLEDQAAVIQFVHDHVAVQAVFEGGGQLQMKMTTAFNRLVKAQGSLNTSVGGVSELLLQAPIKTMEKMVHEACYKNGLAKMMAEIIRLLPTLGQLKSDKGVFVLGHLIGQAAGWELSRNEEQNLLTFVTHLLKMSKEDSVLLHRVELLQTIVLPNLVQPTPDGEDTEPTTPRPSPSRALGLLRVVIETCGEQGTGWVLQCGAAPLLLCLGQMLENCCPLFAAGAGGQAGGQAGGKRALREQLVFVVTRLTKWLVELKDRLSSKTLTWLYNSFLRLHWSSLLYVFPIFMAVDAAKYPMRIPETMAQLVDVPKGWVTFPYNRPGDAVYLVMEAVRVSGGGALLRPLDEPRLDPVDLYSRGVAALAVLLPDSLASECEEMVSWLLRAGVCRSLLPGQILSFTHVHLDDYPGLTQELSACRLLHDVLRMLSDGGLQGASPELNLHVAQTHVTLIKTFSLHPSVTSSDALCVLLTEVFCRLCQQMAYLLTGCTEPLYVMLLDVIQTYATPRSQLTDADDVTQQMTKCQVEAMSTASALCPPEERSMLSKTISQL